MLLTPEPTDERDRWRNRLRFGAGLAVAALVGGLAWVAWPPSEVERALSDGCPWLPQMAEAYAEGDRAAFDTAAGHARRIGFAAFRGGDLTENDQVVGDAAAANAAYETLYRAAYAAPEAVNGASIWRGLELRPGQRTTVDTGLAACTRY